MKTTFKLLTGILGVFLSLSFFGTLPVRAQSAATSATQISTASSAIVLQLGNRSIAVSVLQKLLIKQGYLAAIVPTGYFGSLTKAAVIAFQKSRNLPQTGTFTVSVSALPSFFAIGAAIPTPITIGSTGPQVRLLQQFLIQHDFLKVATTTGYFGSLTKTAVIAFQKAHDLPQTGVIN